MTIAGRRRAPLEAIAANTAGTTIVIADVTEERRLRRDDRSTPRRTRSRRYRHRQRRRRRERTGSAHRSRALAAHDRREPHRRLPHREGRTRRHHARKTATPPRDASCSYRLDRGPQGLSLRRRLLRGQARRRRPAPRFGGRTRAARHHRQRRLPRLHRDAIARRRRRQHRSQDTVARRTTHAPSCRAPIRKAASSRRPRSPPPSPGCAALRRPPSTARRSPSREARHDDRLRRHAPHRSPRRQSTASKERLRLWLRLLRSSRGIETELRERLRVTYDITLPQFDVMAALARRAHGHHHDRAVAVADGLERQRHRHRRSPCRRRPRRAQVPCPAIGAPRSYN